MSYKPNFIKIKHDRVDSNKIPLIKDTYDRIKDKDGVNTRLRKDEPFVLMFRDFIFFDVTSYECLNGDLYIRNIVDGIVLKRYFRMTIDDQLTVFKNRAEFDEFMKKVKTKGYWLGPDKNLGFKDGANNKNLNSMLSMSSDEFVLENYSGLRNSETGDIDIITSSWDGASFTRNECPAFFDKIVETLLANQDKAKIFTKQDFM